MEASLTPVLDRLDWADKHFERLKIELRRYLDSAPGEVVGETEPHTNRLILNVMAKKPVPRDIPLIAGDCIQSLRSSLDYLVWQLVSAAGNKPTISNQFTICTFQAAFEKQVERGRLKGIFPEAQTIIEGVQPYPTRMQHLRILDELCNINKHRNLLMVLFSPVLAQTTIFSTEGESVIYTQGEAQIAIGPPMDVAKKVHVESKMIVHVAINEGLTKGIEVAQCIDIIRQYLRFDVIPLFEKFF